ncbi:MAG: hypothetical protein OEW39_10560 [Deltaproteobacteria bacterium]|nr:hypothetical protein [Deltaproteobacteria bacterium]
MEETRPFAAAPVNPGADFSGEPAVSLRFSARPGVLRSILNTTLPKRRWDPARGFPHFQATWEEHRAGSFGLRTFLELTGLRLQDENLPSLYFHVLGFPLQFAVLTHWAYPIYTWRVRQVRNHLLLHRPLRVGTPVRMTSRVTDWRILDRRQEVDFYSRVDDEAGLVWESLNSYYNPARGDRIHSPSPLAASPLPPEALVERWRLPVGGGLRFGRLTGDFNGVHWWRLYARLLGSPFTFFHMQRVLGFCLARLPELPPGQPQRLDAWLKGPLPYGRDVGLYAAPNAEDGRFALRLEGDPRAAVVGWLRTVPKESSLVNAQGKPVPP